ncbi:hypothetical protein MKX01_002750 [Papaver californicum]|nr:hypothetical protein MKX01_002750 [Papaver californicum]
MSDPTVENAESMMDKITEIIHNHEVSSSDSESESEKYLPSKKSRLFGRQKPVHHVLGGGRSADIILWRDKQTSASIFGGVTVIWLLFEWIGYHLLTFVCHALILSLAVLFLWSNLGSFVNKAPPKFPEILLPEELVVRAALSLRFEINRAFAIFREVSSGKNLKHFLMVIAALWVISVVGSWFNFLTLFYLVYLMMHTLPVLYEKHEDKVDTFAEKALVELNKQYAVFDEKVLQKLPKAMNKSKKQH